jgi:predicted phosphodiesterase
VTAPIVIAGDPHGNFSPILRACDTMAAGTLILLGDCDLHAPLRQVLAPLFAKGWEVHWILGNKDAETEMVFDNLVTDFPQGDIGGRVIEVGVLRIGGLGGVFKPRIWHPREDQPGAAIEAPRFDTRAAFLASLNVREHWRGGLPLWHRDSIFPEDFARLAQRHFDVLISHEAPSCHRHGFAVIDELAEMVGARLIVHGHHHESYMAKLPGGIQVCGLGAAETWALVMEPRAAGSSRRRGSSQQQR